MLANENSNSNAKHQEECQTLSSASSATSSSPEGCCQRLGGHFSRFPCLCVYERTEAFQTHGFRVFTLPAAVFSQQYVVEPSWMCL